MYDNRGGERLTRTWDLVPVANSLKVQYDRQPGDRTRGVFIPIPIPFLAQ